MSHRCLLPDRSRTGALPDHSRKGAAPRRMSHRCAPRPKSHRCRRLTPTRSHGRQPAQPAS
eukprot:10777424-Alexandrium_andersonii.AAC.1